MSGSCFASTLDQMAGQAHAGSCNIVQDVVEHWHEHIGSPTIADAVLDRLVHGAHRLELKGESMRKLRAAKPHQT
jgi:hypothetical protein